MKAKPALSLGVVCAVVISLFLEGCISKRISRELIEVEEVKKLHALYVKVHVKDGSLYLLNNWKIKKDEKVISGNGNYYDFNRRLKKNGKFEIQFNEVAVLETNDPGTNPGVAAMVLMGAVTVPISLYCLVQPKACFGSCPTYYVQSGGKEVLFGEGFSSSICKALEEVDVDLIDFPIDNGPAQITVKNEALETHLIQNANLLAIEKREGERVIQGIDRDFYKIGLQQSPSDAKYNHRSVKDLLDSKDHCEWFSLTDSINLLTKEEIILEFENPEKSSGLLIDQRQSLLTTFLFYHSLSVTGQATGFLLAEIENGNEVLKKRLQKFYDILGGVEIFVQTPQNRWVRVGEIQEAGPIVSDIHFVPLPEIKGENVKVKLRMTKGLWRIDMVNLATIFSKETPRRILPLNVYRNNVCDSLTLRKLLNDEYVVTYPGEVFTIQYPIEFSENHEYFIESEGYYLEWMREDWLKYQDLQLAKRIFSNPTSYLKQMTSAYKAIEPEMEQIFWNSRYTNPK